MAFQKGRSGNPAGRKKGSQDWRGKLRAQLEGATPEIIEALLDKARDGDMQAAKIILDRVLPPLKAQSMPVTLQIPAGDEAARAQSIIAAILTGEVPPDVGNELVGAIRALCQIREVSELEARIAKLEEKTK